MQKAYDKSKDFFDNMTTTLNKDMIKVAIDYNKKNADTFKLQGNEVKDDNNNRNRGMNRGRGYGRGRFRNNYKNNIVIEKEDDEDMCKQLENLGLNVYSWEEIVEKRIKSI